MCVTALSEQSMAGGLVPVECSDFKRGKYKTKKTVDVFDFPTLKKNVYHSAKLGNKTGMYGEYSIAKDNL